MPSHMSGYAIYTTIMLHLQTFSMDKLLQMCREKVGDPRTSLEEQANF
jgi:hypothetical protein